MVILMRIGLLFQFVITQFNLIHHSAGQHHYSRKVYQFNPKMDLHLITVVAHIPYGFKHKRAISILNTNQ